MIKNNIRELLKGRRSSVPKTSNDITSYWQSRSDRTEALILVPFIILLAKNLCDLRIKGKTLLLALLHP